MLLCSTSFFLSYTLRQELAVWWSCHSFLSSLLFHLGSVSGTLNLFHANLDGLVPAASFFTLPGQQAHTAVVR